MSASHAYSDWTRLPLSRPHRISYKPFVVVPAVSPVPHILLIDSDPLFTYCFEKIAREAHLPIRCFSSVESFEKDLRWDYDLIIVDWLTVGGLFLMEFAEGMLAAHGAVAMMVVSESEINAKERKICSKFAHGFSTKDKGVAAVLNDALQTMVVAK